MRINEAYDLPEDFYELIRPYVARERHRILDRPTELIKLWQAALASREQCPSLQESIAEWTVSAGASSPLINDGDLYEAIHTLFGLLEVPAPDNNTSEWRRLKQMVSEAADHMSA